MSVSFAPLTGVSATPRPLRWGLAVLLVLYAVGTGLGALAGMSTSGGALAASSAPASAPAIFVNNLVVLAIMASGVVTAGLTTGSIMTLNGILAGWVVGKALQADSAHQLVTGLLPHALPEIAAYLLGGGASAVLGLGMLAKRARWSGLQAALAMPWATWWRCQGAAVALLAVAALVEGLYSHV